jgi:hypothetical protein
MPTSPRYRRGMHEEVHSDSAFKDKEQVGDRFPEGPDEIRLYSKDPLGHP